MADNQWHVKQETTPGNFRTLHSGDEHSAREYIVNNHPRPHVVYGQDTVRADVQLHGPNGERHEFHGASGTSLLHGVAAVSGNDGWVDLNNPDNDEPDDEPDDDNPPAFTE